MSLILEALRKSEAERRRGAAPDLHAEMPTSPALARSTVPGWVLWMLAAAVAALALAWIAHAWWPRADVETRPVVASAPIVSPAPVLTATKPAAPVLPSVARLSPPPVAAAPPAPVANVAPAEKAAVSAQAAPAALSPPPAYVPPPRPAAVVADDTIALSDLGADERKALPPLKLSMHLWNDDPARRFVILDGNRLKEGDRAGDAVITAITTDGVVLDWNGRRIKLSIR